ncbi:MAG: hypothetical protein EPN91_02320 [Salinibacterium sp.]|nr:MAG: hypothetical protein EPN91_02320 [Salinibacterium sp.]
MSGLTLLEQLTDCLRNAVALMEEENLGCDCGDANDPPCVFCTAKYLLWQSDAENARQRHALESRHGGLHALVEAAKE